MKLEELVKKYNLLVDEGGRYYFIDEEGERREPYATISIIGKTLSLAPTTIEKRIKKYKILPQKIKSATRFSSDGYNINDVISVCKDLLQNIPSINDKGIVYIENEPFATIAVIANQLLLSKDSVRKRIERSKLQPKVVKLKLGQIKSAYNINQVRELCSDLLIEYPIADKKNIATIAGQKYTTMHSLTKLLGLSRNAISLRIKQLRSQKIKLACNRIDNAYNIAEAQEACADLLVNIPFANEDGVALYNGEEYGTIECLIRLFKIYESVLRRRIREFKIKPIAIKVVGVIRKGYEIQKVRAACIDLLETLPVADKNGIATFQGKEIAPLENLSRILNLSTTPIKVRIEKYKVPLVKIKYHYGKVCDGYDLTVIKKICQDLLQPLPTADENNIVIINGRRFTTLSKLAKILKGSNQPILTRLQQAYIEPIKIKNKVGVICDAYEINEAIEICQDYLEELPTVNSENIAVKDGQTYTTRNHLAKMFKTTNQNLGACLKLLKVQTIRIRLKNGNICTAYNLEEVKAAFDTQTR